MASNDFNVRGTFDSLRRTLAPGLARMSATWSDCKNVLWNTRNVMYILCLLSIVLLVSQLLAWNTNFIVFVTGAVTVFAVYGALIASKQSCFSVFDNALVNSFERDGKDVETAGGSCAR